jgi:hypothetical protein
MVKREPSGSAWSIAVRSKSHSTQAFRICHKKCVPSGKPAQTSPSIVRKVSDAAKTSAASARPAAVWRRRVRGHSSAAKQIIAPSAGK